MLLKDRGLAYRWFQSVATNRNAVPQDLQQPAGVVVMAGYENEHFLRAERHRA